MNQLIKAQENENGDLLVSGRDLHEFLDVTERYNSWFERMLQYGFEMDIDFTSVKSFAVVNNGAKREIDDHHIKLDMAKEISMLQRNDKGKQARQYFIELERRWNSPDMVIKRAQDFLIQKVQKLEEQIETDKRFTAFGKVVANSDAAISVGSFAKMVYEKHVINLGRNKMFEWLREQGYLIQDGREKNNPKQRFIEQGLFEVRPTIVSRSEGDVESFTTLITGKGQVALVEKLISHFKGIQSTG